MSRPITASALALRRMRMLALPLLTGATIALLAALPTAAASGAGAGAPSVTVPPTEQVEEVLGQTPLGSLPTDELTKKLSEAPALGGLEPATLETAIKEVIE